MEKKHNLKAVFWTIMYFVGVLAPLLLLVFGPQTADRGFWRELSVALGFAGLSLMGLQFVPTGRLPFLANVFPLDTLYTFHHRVSVFSFLLMLAHPIILFIDNPYALVLLNVFTAPWRAKAAVGAAVGLIILVASSVWRKGFKISYDGWHIGHSLLSLVIAVLALYHIFKVNYYMASTAQQILWIVLAAIWIGALAYVRLIKPWVLLKHPYEVAQVQELRAKSWKLVVEPKGHKGMDFMPGQFSWLQVWTSPFAIEHYPFSMTSSAEHSDYLEFSILEQGDFTSTVKDIPVGKTVYVDGPYGTFSPDIHPAPSYVLIAGGIGIAPMVSILRTMADRGDERPFYLFYGNYNWESITYRDELHELEKELDLTIIHVLENPSEDWDGERGYISKEVLARHLPKDRKQMRYFICGPLPMIDFVESALYELDIPRLMLTIHSEKYEMA